MKKIAKYRIASLAESITRADIVVLLTAHDEFKNLNAAQMKNSIFINTCGPELLGTDLKRLAA